MFIISSHVLIVCLMPRCGYTALMSIQSIYEKYKKIAGIIVALFICQILNNFEIFPVPSYQRCDDAQDVI